MTLTALAHKSDNKKVGAFAPALFAPQGILITCFGQLERQNRPQTRAMSSHASKDSDDSSREEETGEAVFKTQAEHIQDQETSAKQFYPTTAETSTASPAEQTHPKPPRQAEEEEGKGDREGEEQNHVETYIPALHADRGGPPLLLTFDAFGTLYNPRRPIPELYAEAAHKHRYTSITPDQIAQTFPKAYKSVSAQHPIQGRGEITAQDWWSLVADQTFNPLLPSDQYISSALKQTLFDDFATARSYTEYPDVRAFLALVGSSFDAPVWSPRRTMLGVLSNSDGRVRSVLSCFAAPVHPSLFPPRRIPCRRSGSLPRYGPAHFAFATLSRECGAEKPDPRIFLHALRDAQTALDKLVPVARLTRSGATLLRNVNAEFVRVHVGDELDKDVVPALKAGWDAILIDRGMDDAVQERFVDGVGSYLAVNDLMQLPEVLQRERLEQMLQKRRARDGAAATRMVETNVPDEERKYGRRITMHPLERLGTEAEEGVPGEGSGTLEEKIRRRDRWDQSLKILL